MRFHDGSTIENMSLGGFMMCLTLEISLWDVYDVSNLGNISLGGFIMGLASGTRPEGNKYSILSSIFS